MAKDFFNIINVRFPNIWLEAIFHILFYCGVYLLGRVSLKFIKHRALPFFSQGPRGNIKADVFQTFYRLAKRVLQLTMVYYILTAIPFLDKADSLIYNVCFIWALVIGIITIARLCDFILTVLLSDGTIHFLPLFSRISRILIGFIGLAVALKHFNQDIWHIATALGIGSLAVGLAAQPTLTNLIAGFNILVDNPFKVGDRIKLATGDVGDVVDVGLRSTRLRTTDGNMLIVPNADLGNSRVINYSMPDTGFSQPVKFQFDLDADVTKIKLVLSDGLKNVDGLAQPIDVLLSGITDGNIEFTLGIKAHNYSQHGKVTDRVIQESLFILRRNGISFAESKFKSIRT